MITLTRNPQNPILLPSNKNTWEAEAAFNGCAIKDGNTFHMVYRALSTKQAVLQNVLQVSSIGYANSSDGITFSNNRQFITPEEPWELYGCEDPRITKLDEKYYIFYTALSTFPFSAEGIKVAVAISNDLQTIAEKHLITPFNAKAMALFPEKINGKFAVILTANTDKPPAKIGIALFDKEEELWSLDYWNNWYAYVDDHALSLNHPSEDHIEIGAPPIKTDKGWLLLYAYIKNYFSNEKEFGIRAALLDKENPQLVLATIDEQLLTPQKPYELNGLVPNVIFPSGGLIDNDTLFVYYGAADTSCALATCNAAYLLDELTIKHDESIESTPQLKRFSENPILQPIEQHSWEANGTLNPAAVYLNSKIYLLYRAISHHNVSVIGCAVSTDGFHIDERFENPVYIPREVFEKNNRGINYGCEDPRLTIIDDRIYMCYTAYDGSNPPRVALTSISISDFLAGHWHWAIPKLISPPEIDDKDACILPKKVNDSYMIFHRMQNFIWIDFVKDLHFYEGNYLGGSILLQSRPNSWDSKKIGIAAPPLETEKGWLLLYHGIGDDTQYRLGAVLLDKNDPKKIIARTKDPILEPEMKYEKEGIIANVVFPCGAIVKDNMLFVYYGGADKVTGVATIPLDKLLTVLIG